jgi:GNAT superfamily N-acetyltransferase
VARRLQPLTGDTVDDLPGPCSSCLFWELGAARPAQRTATAVAVGLGGGVGEAPAPSEPRVRKQAWVSSQVQDGHPPGRLVRVGDEVVAYALFAPAPTFAPRRPPVPPADPEALLLATAYVQPQWRRRGLGRLLLQAAIKDALRLEAPAVEAYGDRRWRDRACLLPTMWLLHEGFEVHREHPRTPLLRLDVRRTLRWAESFEHALEEILGALPRRAPAPVTEHGLPRGLPEPYRSAPERPAPERPAREGTDAPDG